MIDFKALMNRSDEERESDRERWRVQDEARRAALIEKRKAQIGALESKVAQLTPEQERFVVDMAYRATSYDTDGVFGGRLMDLTDKQVTYLESLARRVSAAAEPAPGSRAARFRSAGG